MLFQGVSVHSVLGEFSEISTNDPDNHSVFGEVPLDFGRLIVDSSKGILGTFSNIILPL